jgi:hypothetical protein
LRGIKPLFIVCWLHIANLRFLPDMITGRYGFSYKNHETKTAACVFPRKQGATAWVHRRSPTGCPLRGKKTSHLPRQYGCYALRLRSKRSLPCNG